MAAEDTSYATVFVVRPFLLKPTETFSSVFAAMQRGLGWEPPQAAVILAAAIEALDQLTA